jgi:hypothetical protein
MESFLAEQQADHDQTVQSLSRVVRSTTQDLYAEKAQHKKSVAVLEKSLTDRGAEVSIANKLLAQERSLQQRDRDSEEAQRQACRDLEAQKVVLQKQVDELTRTQAKQDEFYRNQVAMLEAQLHAQKSLFGHRNNGLLKSIAKQSNPNPEANIPPGSA